MRHFIELCFDGSAYCGWQLQPGSPSVQESLETALRFKASFNGHVTGCGRTDTGVHARQFYAHFDLDKEFDANKLVNQLNSFLPQNITVLRIFSVNSSAHARFDALARTYVYHIETQKNPFTFNYSWYQHNKPDVELMNQAAAMLTRYSDFTSFSKLHTDVKTNNCSVSEALWTAEGSQLIFTIRADRFLRNMVRAIVGTLVDVGRRKITPEAFRLIIESKNRQKAGMSAPANALFLQKVEYDWKKILTF